MTVLVGQLKEADAQLVVYHMADGEPAEELVAHHRADGAGGSGSLHTVGAAAGRSGGAAVAERDARPPDRGSGAGGRGEGKGGQAHVGGVWVARHLGTLAVALGAVTVTVAPARWSMVLGAVVIVVAFLGAPLVALVSGRREHAERRRAGFDLMAGGAAAVIVTVVAALAGQRK